MLYVILSALGVFSLALHTFYMTIKVSVPRSHGDVVLILTPIQYKSLLMKNLSSFYDVGHFAIIVAISQVRPYLIDI